MEKKIIKFADTWVGNEWTSSSITYYNDVDEIVTDTKLAVYYIINENVTIIPTLAFQASPLIQIEIPNTITSIGSGAFSFCSELISVTIPSTINEIGGLAFTDSPNLIAINTVSKKAYENLVEIMSINNPQSVSLIVENDNTIFDCSLIMTNDNNVAPITHSDYVFTNEKHVGGKNKTVTEVLNTKADSINTQTTGFIYWGNENVRFYGERGSVYNQGFSEFYGFPTTEVTMEVNGVTQNVVCVPNDNLVPGNYNTVSGLVREYDVATHDKLREFGGSFSGYSMLGTEGAVNGISGCASIAIERVVDFRITERISFKLFSIVTNGVSYVRITQIDNGGIYLNGVSDVDIPLNGTIEGVPAIKIGEWFSWNIKIPPGYNTSTEMEFYINNILTPIRFKAIPLSISVPKDVCTAKLSSWPTTTYAPLGTGCYSYHTNYGITIMTESSEKLIYNDFLSIYNKLIVITPEGNIPVTLRIEDDIDKLPVGTELVIIGNNTPSTIDIYGNTTFLINGLRNTKIDVWRKMQLDGINIDGNGVNYYMDILTPLIE